MSEHEHECQCCGGSLAVLGALGRLLWFRCRNCGLEFSSPAPRGEDDEPINGGE